MQQATIVVAGNFITRSISTEDCVLRSEAPCSQAKSNGVPVYQRLGTAGDDVAVASLFAWMLHCELVTGELFSQIRAGMLAALCSFGLHSAPHEV